MSNPTPPSLLFMHQLNFTVSTSAHFAANLGVLSLVLLSTFLHLPKATGAVFL